MKLKPEELRIGNIVFIDYGGVDDVPEYRVDAKLILEMVKNPEFINVKGIELTEERLLKCGFIKKEFTDGSQYLEIDKTDYNKFGNPIHTNTETWKCYRLQLFKDEWYFGVYKDPTSNQYFVQKKIYFFHKLQNIYFELADEELIITT